MVKVQMIFLLIFKEVEKTETTSMAVAPSYQSQLSTIYSFDKLDKMTESELNNIYNNNQNNVVYLNSYYNNKVVATANGFFINSGLIVTTWSYLEKSLINAQYITIKGNDTTYELLGIVTANPETDVAVLKVESTTSAVKIGDYKKTNIEDPAIILSSKVGTGLIVQTGIIISNTDYIQTSIPLTNTDEGSPLFNQNGEVIGINTSKTTNSSISIAINSEVLKEIQDKFNSLDNIDSISFEELKEKYYYENINKENIKNSIPKNKWKKYSKIGNIENNIRMELVKDGYKEIIDSTSKTIYKNNKYQVIIMDEFDYLIIVMVKL